MPKTIRGWLMFTVSVVAVLFVVNNVSFLTSIVNRKIS